ncbi:unnamed protein product [Closterium sp. NIES-53]
MPCHAGHQLPHDPVHFPPSLHHALIFHSFSSPSIRHVTEAPYHHLPAAHLFPPFHPANCPVPTPLLSSLLSSSLFSLSRPLLPSPLLSSHLLSSPLFSPSHPHLASPCQLQGGHAPGIEGRQHVCGHASGRHLRWGLCSQIAIVSATQCMSLVLPHGLVVLTVSGGDYTEMGLAATTVASSLGKLVRPADKASPSRRPENLAKAVLLMVTNNIGSIAMLHARPAGVRHVLFTGSFMHNNKLAMRSLAVAMQFWSNGAMKAMFLRHNGHAGALGALLACADRHGVAISPSSKRLSLGNSVNLPTSVM